MQLLFSACWISGLLLVLVLSTAQAQFPLYKSGNVSFSSQYEADFAPRKTASFFFGTAGSGLISLDSTSTFGKGGNATANVQSIWGVTFIPSGGYPTALLAYFDADIGATNLTNFTTFNFSSAGNIMVAAFTQIEEIDQNGNQVKSFSLADDFSWSTALLESGVTESGKLHYLTFVGSYYKLGDFSQLTYKVRLTYIMVEEPMVVNIANVPIVPRSYECIVRISGYNYAATTNQLKLHIYTASGSAGKTVVNGKVSVGSGPGLVYYRLGTTAEVDGATQNVTISNWTELPRSSLASAFSLLLNLLTSKYGSSDAQVYIANTSITFTANANSITYDPASGAGTSAEALFVVDDAPLTPGQLSSGAIAGIVVAAVVVAVIIVIIIVVSVKRVRDKVQPFKNTA